MLSIYHTSDDLYDGRTFFVECTKCNGLFLANKEHNTIARHSDSIRVRCPKCGDVGSFNLVAALATNVWDPRSKVSQL